MVLFGINSSARGMTVEQNETFHGMRQDSHQERTLLVITTTKYFSCRIPKCKPQCHVQLESHSCTILVPPLHWSGSGDAVLLAIVFDTTSDTARSVSQPRTIPVEVFPVGDCFELINSMTVTEDLGPAAVGSVLAAGITLVDDGIIAENTTTRGAHKYNVLTIYCNILDTIQYMGYCNTIHCPSGPIRPFGEDLPRFRTRPIYCSIPWTRPIYCSFHWILRTPWTNQ
jgi:hypothetical protein